MMNSEETDQRERVVPAAVPIDLIAVGIALAVAYGLVAANLGGPVRVLAGAGVVLFLPGYVTIAALFPRGKPAGNGAAGRGTGAGFEPTLRQRAVLALGTSVAVVMPLGLVVGVFTSEFTRALVLNAVSGYVLAVGVVALGRRLTTPATDRFTLPIGAWRAEAANVVSAGSVASRALAIVLVCSALLATGAFAVAVADTTGGESYTDFHLLTNGSDGEYVADDYPDELVEGEPAELAWGIRNSEGVETDYTVVITVERVVQEDGEARRIESVELDRSSATVPAGERTVRDHTVRSPLVGENLRIGYYLYRGDAPDRPDAETAYRHLHVWTTVSPDA